MFAILYLATMLMLGDALSRRFYRFVGWPHRLATSFLVGAIISAPFTYLAALLYAQTSRPLFWANVLYFVIAFVVIFWISWRTPARVNTEDFRKISRWDWPLFGGFLLFACWLMFATLGFRDGKFLIAFKGWSDFGANISVLQSFVLGDNFPTTHPFFPSDPIRYHFIFWFLAADLSYLGLNPVWSVNILSILSLCSLLILIATLAELLFDSRAIGRLASILFLFSSSLSYVPFLRTETLQTFMQRTDYLPSGYPWRGESWGVLTISVLGYQRQLIGGMGILLVVLIGWIRKYRERDLSNVEPVDAEVIDQKGVEESATVVDPAYAFAASGEVELQGTSTDVALVGSVRTDSLVPGSTQDISGDGQGNGLGPTNVDVNELQRKRSIDRSFLYASLFSGVLIGLLPYWNSPAYVASLAVLGCIFLFLPDRLYTAVILLVAIALGAPQVLMLRTQGFNQSLFHWGYTLENPTIFQVVKYLGWSFGFKWLLIGVGLLYVRNWQRKLFLACSSLVLIVFLFQLSVDNFNNHKLLNIWTIFAAIYAAFGLWRVAKLGIAGAVLSVVLIVLSTLGGVIDLFPIHNDPMLVVPHQNDRLTTWTIENTKPTDLFLSQRWLTHPILFAGRKVFLGNTLFAWTAGYAVGPREAAYKRMFEEHDPAALIRLLNENKITYVAIDNGVRQSPLIKNLNEMVYQTTFEKVFDDTEKQYDELSIYRVSAMKSGNLKSQ